MFDCLPTTLCSREVITLDVRPNLLVEVFEQDCLAHYPQYICMQLIL